MSSKLSSKMSSKIVIKNCHQKLSSKIVVKNGRQKWSSKMSSKIAKIVKKIVKMLVRSCFLKGHGLLGGSLMSKNKRWLSQSVSQSVTHSPIELSGDSQKKLSILLSVNLLSSSYLSPQWTETWKPCCIRRSLSISLLTSEQKNHSICGRPMREGEGEAADQWEARRECSLLPPLVAKTWIRAHVQNRAAGLGRSHMESLVYKRVF